MIHADEDDGTRLHYLDASDFARHLLDLQRRRAHEDLRAALGVIEALYLDGDEYVRELATMPCLGPQSRRWWRGLDDFWSGRASTVVAVEDDS